MTTMKKMREDLLAVQSNPAAMQRTIYDTLQSASENGDDIVDPSNPFVFLMEAAVSCTGAFMDQQKVLTRKQYPVHAITEEDLYLHMADSDYVGRFASPSRTSFTLLLGKEEVIRKAVSTNTGGIRKLVIPKHTEFTIVGIRFSLQYPIEIRIMSHGGIQIVYDATEESPLVSLESNLLTWSITRIKQTDFIAIRIPANQFRIASHYGQLNPSTGFNETFSYTDQFYFARAYLEQADGSWKEVKTTHTDQVYDVRTFTVVLKVLEGQLNVRVPQIYFTEGMAQRNLRVDIYSTRGKMDLPLGEYRTSEFGVTWRDLDRTETSRFSAPLNSFSTMILFSDQRARGGNNAIGIDELRRRVISNSNGQAMLPITGQQLEAAGEDLGYQIVKSVDNVTERIYKATRSLPEPSLEGTITPAALRISTIQESMETLGDYANAKDNGARITLTPNMLYERKDGLTNPVSDQRMTELNEMDYETLIATVNEGRFLYTPFHYVLDGSDSAFDLRAYLLDFPEIVNKQFVQENDTAQLEVATSSYSIERTAEGYRLMIATRSGDAFKSLDDANVHVQLAYTPVSENNRAYMTGQLYGKTESNERVYRFDLPTDFDIDDQNGLKLLGFNMFDTDPRITTSKLTQDFEVIYIVSDYEIEGMEASDIDEIYGYFMLGEGDYVGIAHEILKVRFGYALDNLWRRSRTVAGSLNYERWEVDEPLVYENTVFERDPGTGNIKLTYDSATGEIDYVVLHRAGDPVLNESGEPRYRHRAGEPKIDEQGMPIVKDGRGLVRQFDLLLIDGVWRFATDEASVEYRREVASTLADWVSQDIGSLAQRLLERTRLYFYPKTTFGEVPVYVESGRETEVNAEQSFTVKMYLTSERFDRLELREPLTQAAIETISTALRSSTISLSEINTRIKEAVGSDVLSVETRGLSGEAGFSTITLRNSDSSCILKKRLRRRSNGSLVAEDDVSVEFIRHTQ